jgi:bifunctional aspartokinase / homoserine dehydrogenase 1
MVHKFGGTSLADADRFRAVSKILKSQDGSSAHFVIVSAMAGVTDTLIELTRLASNRDLAYEQSLKQVKEKHEAVAGELLNLESLNKFKEKLARDAAEINDVLRATSTLKTAGEQVVDLVSGFGEIWSAHLLAEFLKNHGASSEWLDARRVIFVESSSNGPVILWEESQKALEKQNAFLSHDICIFTGYVASFKDGGPTTLKRNGSDWSAAIMAKLLKAKSLTIWKEVDGVMSADPRIVPEAFMLSDLSYKEANELAFFGAKVLHPKTMAPAMECRIPIWIRNSFRPEDRGTLIHFPDDTRPKGPASLAVKGFALVDHVALISLEGTGMMGVPGIAQRLFGALREVSVSVIMISQASSEQSICFAVPFDQGDLAKHTVEKSFFSEIHHGLIQKIDVSEKCSILAAVGDNMVHSPGVAASLFRALSHAGVNVRAIAQGSSERNISVVVSHSDRHRALRAAHSGFYLSDQTISVGLIGPGLIGETLLKQIADRLVTLKNQYKVDIRIRAIANSKKMLLSDESIPLGEWKERFQKSQTPTDYAELVRHVKPFYLPHSVIIDCTASEAVSKLYEGWMKAGLHLITPNKKANSSDFSYYKNLMSLRSVHRVHYLYSTTVGAGLPVISTLKDLVQTGDQITRIEGVLSGTLSFIFNSLNDRTTFSEVVKQAKEKGFTEPDPRDDLSGMDVARKLIILSREMGQHYELKDVEVESLVPKPLRTNITPEEFMRDLPKFDGEISSRMKKAKEADSVLRFVGVIEPGRAPAVKLQQYPKQHPFARLTGSDNIVSFTTDRYKVQPLIVQGPGAGPEVTAAGAFADLLRLSTFLGAVK